MSMIHMHYRLGVTAVLCETRCGHTSMKEHFNAILGNPMGTNQLNGYVDSTHKDLHHSDNLGNTHIVNNKSISLVGGIKADRIVLVVRQPYDRLWSSKTHIDRMIQDGWLRKRLRDKWISDHSSLYLHQMSQLTNITHIIPFQNLSEYIPVSANTVQYNIAPNHTRFEDWMGHYHSQDDMEKEYTGYIKLLNSIPQFSVAKWQKYCV